MKFDTTTDRWLAWQSLVTSIETVTRIEYVKWSIKTVVFCALTSSIYSLVILKHYASSTTQVLL